MIPVMRRERGERGYGQTMTEFAIVLPVLFMLMLGVLDGGLLMFSVGTARYATVEGARMAAQLGNAATTDDQSIRVIREHVGATGIFTVDEVDVYKLNQDANGNLTPDPVLFNRYRIDGTPMTSGYIAIQAETAPTDFRKIELLNLEGCMDPKASNYKKYFVKASNQTCRY